MLILFDQNTPRPLRKFLPKHTVKTAGEMGWARLTNTDLLNAAEEAGFELLVTSDQNLTSQQNLANRGIGVAVLGSGRWSRIQRQLSRVVAAIDAAQPGTYTFVKIAGR
jgi:hypothetical protein